MTFTHKLTGAPIIDDHQALDNPGRHKEAGLAPVKRGPCPCVGRFAASRAASGSKW
jgi:hypothetical protein